MTVEGFELTEELCAHIWAQHLNEPVGGYNCCPITFVLWHNDYPNAAAGRRIWTEDIRLAAGRKKEHDLPPALSEFTHLADQRQWESITGAVALELLAQARRIVA